MMTLGASIPIRNLKIAVNGITPSAPNPPPKLSLRQRHRLAPFDARDVEREYSSRSANVAFFCTRLAKR